MNFETKQTSLKIPLEIYGRLMILAKEDSRTAHNLINLILKQYTDKAKRRKKAS